MTRLLLGLALAVALAGPVAAQGAAPSAAKKDRGALGGFGGTGKEPIKIDADRLDVFDRENKAIFAGNVVAVQGDSTIRCSTMTVHYQRGKDSGGKDSGSKDSGSKDAGSKDSGSKDAAKDAAAKEPEAKDPKASAGGDNAIRQVDCAGPVTVVSKDQVATGDNAVFDRVANRVVLTGNVVLSQCQNVTRGSRLVYDLNSGRANMDPQAGGRVSAMFVPGGKNEGSGKGCAQPAQPAQAGKAAPKPRAQAN